MKSPKITSRCKVDRPRTLKPSAPPAPTGKGIQSSTSASTRRITETPRGWNRKAAVNRSGRISTIGVVRSMGIAPPWIRDQPSSTPATINHQSQRRKSLKCSGRLASRAASSSGARLSCPASNVTSSAPTQPANTNITSFVMAWKTSRWGPQRAASSRTKRGSRLIRLPRASAPGIAWTCSAPSTEPSQRPGITDQPQRRAKAQARPEGSQIGGTPSTKAA